MNNLVYLTLKAQQITFNKEKFIISQVGYGFSSQTFECP